MIFLNKDIKKLKGGFSILVNKLPPNLHNKIIIPIKSYSKGLQGLFVPLKFFVFSQKFQIHRTNSWDSVKIIKSFMQDGNYPPINFATLRSSRLRPPFTLLLVKNNYNFPYVKAVGRFQTLYIIIKICKVLCF